MKQAMQWMAAAVLAAGTMLSGSACVSRHALEAERTARAQAEARAAVEAAQSAAARKEALDAREEARDAREEARAATAEARKATAEARKAAADAESAQKALEAESARRKAAQARIRKAEPALRAPVSETEAAAASEPAGSASETARHLRVRLALDDGRPAGDSGTLAAALRARVEGALADAGFRVVEAGPFEVAADVALRARQVNSRGSRVAWEGDADAAVRIRLSGADGPDTVQDVSRSWTDVASGEARSADAAQKKLAEALAAELAPFTAEAANRVGERLRLVEVTVQKAWTAKEADAYPALFVSEVLAMPGVYRCEVSDFDKKAKILRAEVVYDKGAYPEGFANRLQLNPDLGFRKK